MRNQFPQLMILRTSSVPAYSVPNSEAESSVATTSSSAKLDRKEVDKAFAQVCRGCRADALHPHGFDASLQQTADPPFFILRQDEWNDRRTGRRCPW